MSKPIVAGGSEQAKKICKILGIQPGKVAQIKIIINPEDVIHAMVKLYIHNDQMDELNTILVRRDLVPAGTDRNEES